MKKLFLVSAIFGFAALTAPTLPAQNSDEGLDLWSKVHAVFSHPRCASCHVEDGHPRWMGNGDMEPIKHPMFVGGNPENLTGEPGAMCTTCHGPVSSSIEGGPPGAEVWLLAPKEMVWFGKSSAQICAQIKDPDRNGGKTLEQVAEHLRNDHLVHSGWHPVPGRDAAPFSAEETADYFSAWIDAGAPCPTE